MKKITSVIVSIALICTIFFPAIKLVTSADTVETAVLQLQTAWKDIRKKSNKLNLFAYNDGTNTVFFENGINESTVNVELKKIIKLKKVMIKK
mgnify:CR=1 FL=1